MSLPDPIERLLAEHERIMEQVAELRRALRDLETRGDAAIPAALPALQAVGRMMATELEAHARREDEALFPALEAVFGREGTPTAVMRREHQDIHGEAERFRELLHLLNEVEHPAIEEGGERLRVQVSAGAPATELLRTGTEIVRLLDAHFGKEEQVLFPMARALLSDDDLQRVARRMEALDSGG